MPTSGHPSYICPLMTPVHHTIYGNTFWLLAQKALYWEEQKTVILSDLHLGKTGHFRKEGIAVPQGVYKNDLHRLFDIIQQYKPDQLIIAGDMFHSKMNREVDLFTRWRKDVSQLYIHLIKGNHDILHDDNYAQADIKVTDCSFAMERFCFVHDINDVDFETSTVNSQSANGKTEKVKTIKKPGTSVNHNVQEKQHYYFSGHIHPGVVLRTGTRQSVCLPCYYFGKDYAVLPAFSAFTGVYPVTPKKGDCVFAVIKDNVMRVKPV